LSKEEDFSLISHLIVIEDPRIDRTKKHELIDILVIAIGAAICGTETWTEIEDFGEEKESWFKNFLNIKHGISLQDTLQRFLMRLDPLVFIEVYYHWVCSINKTRKERSYLY
jgi:hypothetical protein